MNFVDVTGPSGITHVHSHDLSASFTTKEYSWLTGGAVAEDFNSDGWVDLFVLQGGASANLLYINRGDGSFINEAVARGVDQTGTHMGVAAADYDGDHDVDLFVSSMKPPNLLLINDGSGKFSLDTTQFTWATKTPDPFPSSPSWVDVNNDGLLDAALGTWRSYPPGDLQIYRNGGKGRFLSKQTLPKDYNFVCLFADLDGDRFQDLIAVSDFGHTSWYRNNRNGIFLEIGSSDVENGMGAATGDIDNDGDLDVFISSIRDFDGSQKNWGETGNRLLVNDGDGNLTDITTAAGVRDGFWGWGSVFSDFDNDGDLDIYHVNGWPETRYNAPLEFNNTPARLFENLGGNKFSEVSAASGDAAHTGQGRAAISFDYDNDGDLDIFIANNSNLVDLGDDNYRLDPGVPVLLRNDTISSRHWLKVKLQGDGPPHHSHGIGSRVYIENGFLTQMRELNASSGFNGHGPNRIAHFGLAMTMQVDRVRAVWTNGDETQVSNVKANQELTISSPKATVSSPSILPGDSVTLEFPLSDFPLETEVVWTVGTVNLGNPATVTLGTPGSHRLRADVFSDSSRETLLRTETLLVEVADQGGITKSIARIWNEENLAAIRIDFPNPCVHARNLFHLSVAMWDAWVAYDKQGLGYFHREPAQAFDVELARREAISYAAYRILYSRYSQSVNASTTKALLDQRMNDLGYSTKITTTVGPSPAALGNRVAASILACGNSDGSREKQYYVDPGYSAINAPLVIAGTGNSLSDPNRWQPLEFQVALSQNGLVTDKVQIYQASHWGSVRPFSLVREGATYLDPGPPPLLGGKGDNVYKYGNTEIIQYSSWLDSDDGVTIDTSPAARGMNTLGFNDGNGHGNTPNPATGLPYPPNLVKRADYIRAIAEFWADGPDSETPPGHWNTLANGVADHPDFKKRFRGLGDELENLEWDVKIYFALNAALHDAAIAAWGCKRVYDYIRPISSIRFLGVTGQLPKVPGLVEKITTASSAPGERHSRLVATGAKLGDTAIYSWVGEPEDVEKQYSGSDWILAANWLPYQRDTFVTPAFAGYVSGHSCFSRTGAELLTHMTGNEYFPGGIKTHVVKAGSLEFELGPSADITLQWARYYDASDEAGLSRLYGGIHFPADDGPGRIMGSAVGIRAMEIAEKYFDGSIANTQLTCNVTHSAQGIVLEWSTVRGFYYKVQSSYDLTQWSDLTKIVQALDDKMSHTILNEDPCLFMRVFQTTDPR